MTIASVVIPAHNEHASISRLLGALAHGVDIGDLDVLVVCNACADGTADLARTFAGVRVLEVPEPSKRLAQLAGDRATTAYPRAYVDADVVITGADVVRLAGVITSGAALAAAPARQLDLLGAHWVVRRYYDVWRRLPQVRTGLFGRGVVVLGEQGVARLAALPHLMSDDLAMSDAFEPGERLVVEACTVTVSVPRTPRDLLRRRVRVATGNAQADIAGARRAESHTSVRSLMVLARDPRAAIGMPVFLAVTLASRVLAARRVRRGDFSTWLRDESSRSG